MSCNPAYIGGTPIDIIVFDIKRPFEGNVGIEVITSRTVNYSFGFTSRTASIENKQ